MNMMVKTLWVDDQIEELYSAYKLETDAYGIELVPFDCWEKAKVELVNHYDDYSAIILDARCVLKDGEDDDTMRFLPEVLKQLGIMASERHKLYHGLFFQQVVELLDLCIG